MSRRHKLDIFADILRLAVDGTKTTRLVYKANTNFTKIKDYLQTLSERGLIELHDGHLRTTDKGIEYLEKYEKLMLVFNSFEKAEIDEEDGAEDLVLMKNEKE